MNLALLDLGITEYLNNFEQPNPNPKIQICKTEICKKGLQQDCWYNLAKQKFIPVDHA